MAIDISPRDRVRIQEVWPIAGPLIKGTLESFKTVFAAHPTEVFTGERVAQIM